MPDRFLLRLVVCGVVAALLSAASDSAAEDYFLTIGGGYDRSGNQVSLERNVVFQRNVLAAVRPDKPRAEVYFADGDSANADLQYRDPDFKKKCPRARRLIGRLFGDWSDIDLRYREHGLTDLAGPAEIDLLRRRMKRLAGELQDGDRLVLYFTGHGGEADDPNEYRRYDDEDDDAEYNRYDTTMYLWDSESISASEFTAMLDRLPEGVTVVMVMVQCFSGGFAHTIFHQADEGLGLAPHHRVGFFSQRHDRYAAGCTPDVNEADYQEYSSFFWAAIGGRNRGGETVDADADGDGAVTMAEAHAYAVVESNTIDIPTRTTGALLRKYSSLAKNAGKESGDGEPAENPIGAFFSMLGKKAGESDGDKPELVKLSGPLQRLAERGRPYQQRIVERLAEKLELGDAPTVEAARSKLKQLEQRGVDANARVELARMAWGEAIEKLTDRLTERWPELETPYSPVSMALGSERADEFLAAIDAMPSLEEGFRNADKRYDEALERQSHNEEQQAKAERLLRTCENIVLAANLPQVAPEAIIARYEKLLALEESPLTPPNDEGASDAVAVETGEAAEEVVATD